MSLRTECFSIYQVDAFADAAFKGNPAAVVPLEKWLPDETMQFIAMENQLSETAFFVPEEDRFDLRWFTPVSEVDLCGHATLAAAHVLLEELGQGGIEVTFQSRSGELVVEKTNGGYRMDFPADEISPDESGSLASALNVEVKELYRGKDDFLAILDSEKTVRDLRPDFRKLAELDIRGVLTSAPANDGEDLDFVSRCFFPKYGIDEDPVTGSAHTTMAPYWASRLDRTRLKAAQLSARGGRLECEVSGDRVLLSGEAVTFLRGEIFVPQHES